MTTRRAGRGRCQQRVSTTRTHQRRRAWWRHSGAVPYNRRTTRRAPTGSYQRIRRGGASVPIRPFIRGNADERPRGPTGVGALITRRSQVQILSPPPKKALVRTTIRPGLLSFSGPLLPDLSTRFRELVNGVSRTCRSQLPFDRNHRRLVDDSWLVGDSSSTGRERVRSSVTRRSLQASPLRVDNPNDSQRWHVARLSKG